MRFKFTVEIEISRQQGKFASRDEMVEQTQAALDDANPGQLDGENGGEYTVEDWTASES